VPRATHTLFHVVGLERHRLSYERHRLSYERHRLSYERHRLSYAVCRHTHSLACGARLKGDTERDTHFPLCCGWFCFVYLETHTLSLVRCTSRERHTLPPVLRLVLFCFVYLETHTLSLVRCTIRGRHTLPGVVRLVLFCLPQITLSLSCVVRV